MDRKTLAARIRAILAKTVENGATEAEAMSAVAGAQRLMEKYHIDHGALGIEEEGTERRDIKRGRGPRQDVRDRLAPAIAKFCDCVGWQNTSRAVNSNIFFGLPSDVDFAVWLLDSLTNFVEAQCGGFALDKLFNEDRPISEAERNGFMIACARRIVERLKELTAARQPTAAATGNALIVLKNQIVQREFNKLGIHLRNGSFASRNTDGAAMAAGRAAGDRASFGRPVQGPRPLMIGN